MPLEPVLVDVTDKVSVDAPLSLYLSLRSKDILIYWNQLRNRATEHAFHLSVQIPPPLSQ